MAANKRFERQAWSLVLQGFDHGDFSSWGWSQPKKYRKISIASFRRINVWFIFQHSVDLTVHNVGKYTSRIDTGDGRNPEPTGMYNPGE